jgi:hypothetical protein
MDGIKQKGRENRGARNRLPVAVAIAGSEISPACTGKGPIGHD